MPGLNSSPSSQTIYVGRTRYDISSDGKVGTTRISRLEYFKRWLQRDASHTTQFTEKVGKRVKVKPISSYKVSGFEEFKRKNSFRKKVKSIVSKARLIAGRPKEAKERILGAYTTLASQRDQFKSTADTFKRAVKKVNSDSKRVIGGGKSLKGTLERLKALSDIKMNESGRLAEAQNELQRANNHLLELEGWQRKRDKVHDEFFSAKKDLLEGHQDRKEELDKKQNDLLEENSRSRDAALSTLDREYKVSESGDVADKSKYELYIDEKRKIITAYEQFAEVIHDGYRLAKEDLDGHWSQIDKTLTSDELKMERLKDREMIDTLRGAINSKQTIVNQWFEVENRRILKEQQEKELRAAWLRTPEGQAFTARQSAAAQKPASQHSQQTFPTSMVGGQSPAFPTDAPPASQPPIRPRENNTHTTHTTTTSSTIPSATQSGSQPAQQGPTPAPRTSLNQPGQPVLGQSQNDVSISQEFQTRVDQQAADQQEFRTQLNSAGRTFQAPGNDQHLRGLEEQIKAFEQKSQAELESMRAAYNNAVKQSNQQQADAILQQFDQKSQLDREKLQQELNAVFQQTMGAEPRIQRTTTTKTRTASHSYGASPVAAGQSGAVRRQSNVHVSTSGVDLADPSLLDKIDKQIKKQSEEGFKSKFLVKDSALRYKSRDGVFPVRQDAEGHLYVDQGQLGAFKIVRGNSPVTISSDGKAQTMTKGSFQPTTWTSTRAIGGDFERSKRAIEGSVKQQPPVQVKGKARVSESVAYSFTADELEGINKSIKQNRGWGIKRPSHFRVDLVKNQLFFKSNADDKGEGIPVAKLPNGQFAIQVPGNSDWAPLQVVPNFSKQQYKGCHFGIDSDIPQRAKPTYMPALHNDNQGGRFIPDKDDHPWCWPVSVDKSYQAMEAGKHNTRNINEAPLTRQQPRQNRGDASAEIREIRQDVAGKHQAWFEKFNKRTDYVKGSNAVLESVLTEMEQDYQEFIRRFGDAENRAEKASGRSYIDQLNQWSRGEVELYNKHQKEHRKQASNLLRAKSGSLDKATAPPASRSPSYRDIAMQGSHDNDSIGNADDLLREDEERSRRREGDGVSVGGGSFVSAGSTRPLACVMSSDQVFVGTRDGKRLQSAHLKQSEEEGLMSIHWDDKPVDSLQCDKEDSLYIPSGDKTDERCVFVTYDGTNRRLHQDEEGFYLNTQQSNGQEVQVNVVLHKDCLKKN